MQIVARTVLVTERIDTKEQLAALTLETMNHCMSCCSALTGNMKAAMAVIVKRYNDTKQWRNSDPLEMHTQCIIPELRRPLRISLYEIFASTPVSSLERVSPRVVNLRIRFSRGVIHRVLRFQPPRDDTGGGSALWSTSPRQRHDAPQF